ncbi:MAG: GNAT family N-acetyltransferase [Saprospiraceae bacterium]
MPTITRATLPCLEQLRQIAVETFTDTYGAMNTPENMRHYIAKAFNTDRLATELQSPLCQYWLAMSNGIIVGYVKVNFAGAQTDIHDPRSLELERIYVVPAHKGKGTGSLLIEKVMEVAREHGLQNVWLGVWEKNEKAIRFYEKMGFQKTGTHQFVLGDEEQTDFVMKFFIW